MWDPCVACCIYSRHAAHGMTAITPHLKYCLGKCVCVGGVMHALARVDCECIPTGLQMLVAKLGHSLLVDVSVLHIIQVM